MCNFPAVGLCLTFDPGTVKVNALVLPVGESAVITADFVWRRMEAGASSLIAIKQMVKN